MITNKHRITRQKATEALQAGLPLWQVTELAQCSMTTARRIARKLGLIGPREPAVPKHLYPEIQRRLRAGESMPKIAKALGVKAPTLRQLAHRQGWRLRKKLTTPRVVWTPAMDRYLRANYGGRGYATRIAKHFGIPRKCVGTRVGLLRLREQAREPAC